MAKKNKWTYYQAATITLPDGTQESYSSQVYMIGIYIIWNNDPSSQGNMKPAAMEKMCKKIQKDVDSGKISKVDWGTEVTVKDLNGLYAQEL